ncbi:hypothetical protein LTR37_019922 [Vermiconidia calcicola]|uniref:Uncharacterized protein n=1 Tax=Vermiconidia calcicola TaxID=1690605 RepID=A0ACC3MCR3_9PEZI|nr:hypothetical protein LTR37_019922 [Vermiconidia calcicola]
MKSLDTDLAGINAKGQVPVFVVDGNVITEVPAIAQMINLLAPDAKVMGSGQLEFIRTWGPYVRPFRFTNESSAEEGIRVRAVERLHQKFEMIESKLSEDGWAVGENFTAVDAFLLAISQWAGGRMGVDLEAKYPRWKKLTDRVRALESVQSALAEERSIDEKQKA